MADFYAEMAKMASDILKPTSKGGLGQGVVELAKTVSGQPNPDKPWELPVESEVKEKINGAVRGIDSKLVGTEYGSATLLATDKVVTTEVPKTGYSASDSIYLDGVKHRILGVEPIPAVGVMSACKFIVRS